MSDIAGTLLMKIEKLERIIACATDLLNTWAREVGAEECTDPVADEFALRNLVDRVWETSSEKIGDLEEELAVADDEIDSMRNQLASAEQKISEMEADIHWLRPPG